MEFSFPRIHRKSDPLKIFKFASHLLIYFTQIYTTSRRKYHRSPKTCCGSDFAFSFLLIFFQISSILQQTFPNSSFFQWIWETIGFFNKLFFRSANFYQSKYLFFHLKTFWVYHWLCGRLIIIDLMNERITITD